MKMGIIGQPSSGKTTLFNSITGLDEQTGTGQRKINIGEIKVPDERIEYLVEVENPAKITYANIQLVDVGGNLDAKNAKSNNEIINQIRTMDALTIVVEDFLHENKLLSNLRSSVEDLILHDLDMIDKRLERLKKEKAKNNAEPSVLERLKGILEDEKLLNEEEYNSQELEVMKVFNFLSTKPLQIIINQSDDATEDSITKEFKEYANEHNLKYFPFKGEIELEISKLSEDEQKDFLADYGLSESIKNRYIKASYDLMNYISFLTAGPKEVRAWPIKKGLSALEAAGKIHTDIQRGFIRAEIIPYETYKEFKGIESKIKEAGRMRLEGKAYIVQDGDVVVFRFNI